MTLVQQALLAYTSLSQHQDQRRLCRDCLDDAIRQELSGISWGQIYQTEQVPENVVNSAKPHI